MAGATPTTLFEFESKIAGGTDPYTFSWDFGDGSEGSDEKIFEHTFEVPGTHNVVANITGIVMVRLHLTAWISQ